MYPYRAGPSRKTAAPANARHYSYECKVSTQERPYIARPSRTQQLRNPKLVPKLTNDTPPVPEKKDEVASSALAKNEADKARKRRLSEDEASSHGSRPRRRRSPSESSSGSISTRSPSPVSRRQGAGSPQRRPPPVSRSISPRVSRANRDAAGPNDPDYRRASLSPGGDYRHGTRSRSSSRSWSGERSRSSSRSRSRSRSRSHSRSPSRSLSRSRSPIRVESHIERRRDRSESFERRDPRPRSRRDYSASPAHPAPAVAVADDRDGRWREEARRYRDRDDRRPRRDSWSPRPERRNAAPPPPPPPPPRRERSLSPFSKRLALTQAMNLSR